MLILCYLFFFILIFLLLRIEAIAYMRCWHLLFFIKSIVNIQLLNTFITASAAKIAFIDSLFFKGNKLEITSYLDSDCKSSEVVIYSN